MIRFLPDTSCLVAVLCTWHEHHESTRRNLEKRLAAGQQLVLAAHCLVETYSVLTRLPFPFRISETDAYELITINWNHTEVIALSAREYWKILKDATRRGTGGGQIYDAVIAACVHKGKVQELLTWNLDHFSPFEHGDLTITTPSQQKG